MGERATDAMVPGFNISELDAPSTWALSLLEESQDLMCLCNEGRIRYLNSGGARLLGLGSADLALGRSFIDFIHDDYVHVSIDLLGYLAEQDEALPLKLAGRDGKDRDVEIRCRPLESSSPLILVHGRDMTERVMNARIQHQRELALRDIIDAVPDPVLVVVETGIVEYCNRAAERFFGRPIPTMMNRPTAQLLGFCGQELTDLKDLFQSAGKFVLTRVANAATATLADGRSVPIEFTVTELTRHQKRAVALVIRPAQTAAEKRKRERKPDSSLHLSASILENMDEAVIVADSQFRVVSVNRAFTRITGYEPGEIIGRKPLFMDVVERDANLYSRMWKSIAANGYWESEIWNQRKDGKEFAERVSLCATRDESGHVVEYSAVVSDITQKKRDEEKLRYQANYDELTGIPNRALFLDRVKMAVSSAGREKSKLALFVIDLDGFKLVNDTFGHEVGDQLLQEAARRLTSCVRTGDTVARIGGDEFSILMIGIEQPRNAPILAERILESLAKPFLLKDQESYISGSIGIAVYPDDGETVGDLFRNADAAMYRAKEQGKANYQFYTAELNTEVHERLQLKTGLKRAQVRGEFELHYQPKLNLETGRVTGAEALMRWTSQELGPVSPARFIPVLEETGMIVEVGEWALREACRQYVSWSELGIPSVPVAVNLSPRQLRERNFAAVLESILSESGMPSDGIEVEITESMLMSDVPNGIDTLNAIHEMGVHISMDDFGTGYSSLSYLKRFPIDAIKIDKSFVLDIATDQDDREIVSTIISMGHALNRRIIAEGVETKDQYDALMTYKCDEIQGFYFSRPLPPADATRFLQDHFAVNIRSVETSSMRSVSET